MQDFIVAKSQLNFIKLFGKPLLRQLEQQVFEQNFLNVKIFFTG